MFSAIRGRTEVLEKLPLYHPDAGNLQALESNVLIFSQLSACSYALSHGFAELFWVIPEKGCDSLPVNIRSIIGSRYLDINAAAVDVIKKHGAVIEPDLRGLPSTHLLVMDAARIVDFRQPVIDAGRDLIPWLIRMFGDRPAARRVIPVQINTMHAGFGRAGAE